MAINIAFIFSLLLLIVKIKNKILSGLLTFFISLILSVSISFALLFSSPLAVGNIASFFETNFSEVVSLPLSFYSTFLGCLLLTTILLFRVKKELADLFRLKCVGCLFVAIFFIINVFAILVPVSRQTQFIDYYRKELREVPLQTIYAYSSVRSPLLYGDIFGLAVYLVEKFEFRRFKNLEKKLGEGVILEKGKKSIPKIYLVIGESAYRKRMSLYDYEIKTTPFLDSIAKADSSSINFYDGISSANITRDAVRFSLSFATPFNKDAFWTEKNVVEMAREASYHTVWISNQGRAGLYDNYPSYIAKSSEAVYFENKLRKEDLDLLSLIPTYDGKGDKELIVLHLMGSHFPFSERYDEVDNTYFKLHYSEYVSSDTIFKYFDSVFDYDKSIHHTDRFLQGLYDYTISHNESSIIVYFSDHGGNPHRDVHGTLEFNESEFEIPFVVLKNNVEIDIDSIIQQYLSGGKINNVNLSYILSELMGYSVDDKAITKAQEDGENVMLVNGFIVPFGLMGIVCF